MKKKLLAILMTTALLAGALAGCGGSSEPETKAAPASESTSESAPAAAAEPAAKTGKAASSASDGEITAEDILATLTLGFAGASEAGEELYLALDEDVDYGIIGIVGDETTFLFGGITEDSDGLTITDIETGDSLSFTVSEPQEDENGTYVEVDFDGVAAVLYACDASAVIEAMSQY